MSSTYCRLSIPSSCNGCIQIQWLLATGQTAHDRRQTPCDHSSVQQLQHWGAPDTLNCCLGECRGQSAPVPWPKGAGGKKNKKNLLSIVKSPNLQGASWGNTKMPTPAHSLPPRASLDWDRLVTRLQYFLFLLFLTLTRAHPDPGTCHTWSKNQILKPQTWCL